MRPRRARLAARRRPRPAKRRPRRKGPVLRFTPYAWAKLRFLRDLESCEVGGFGVTTPEDPLLVEDVLLVQQECTSVSVSFDDNAVADFFDEQVDAGRRPENFARLMSS